MVSFSKHAISSLLAGCLILSLKSTVAEAEHADIECTGDVVQVRQVGGTMYGDDKPIKLLTQNTDEITFALSQEWAPSNLDYLFVRYKETAFGSPKCLTFEGVDSAWKSESLTAVCTKNSQIALVEVWASDSEFNSGLDNATLPDCSCDVPDSATVPLTPMVKYMFTVECVSTCAAAACPAIAVAPFDSPAPPTLAPTAAPVCDFGDSLHAVCQSVAIHARDTITFASGEKSRVVGDIGVYPGTSITGQHEIKPGGQKLYLGQSQAFSETMWGTDGLKTTDGVYAEKYARRAAADEFFLGEAAEIGGERFYPGTYRSETAINFAYGTTITLDGLGDENAQWLFQAGTTLITAADTYFILINGAQAKNVLWVLGTAATLGARSILEGSILAGSSVTYGTMSEVRGCTIAWNAVTFESRGYVNVRVQTDGDPSCPNGLGSCENFAVHARDTVTFAGTAKPSVITNGDLGVAPGTSITGLYELDGGVREYGSGDYAIRVMFNHADLRSRRSDEVYWGIGIHEIGGSTIYPGTYRVGEAINFALGPPVTLDARGDEDAIFLFQAGSTFVTAADAYFIMKNGAKPENVIWALGTAATLGARSVVQGSVLAGTAITMGVNSEIIGCAIAMTATSFETEGFVTMPLNYTGLL